MSYSIQLNAPATLKVTTTKSQSTKEETENGISFRLMGTSPVMVGFKKTATVDKVAANTDSKTNVSTNKVSSPKTGDRQPIALWVSILALSVLGIAWVTIKQKRLK